MSLRDAIIITVFLSQSVCEAGGKGLGLTLLQGLLSSNPQLSKMLSNKIIQQSSLQRPYYNAPILNAQTTVPVIPASSQYVPVLQNYQKSQFSQAKVEYPAQYIYQNVQKEPQKEVKYVQSQQYPVSYSTVQQTTEMCPSKPNPFVSPAPMVNPFLPAASPISALCPPTSSILPPANPALARSQFLRKIPIPPPYI
ncbi:uncharacterized protein LOC134676970 [Cydia fagiglandana]|uniref:uncharacterized protein LOC134676970 n=1 Tax=Cydia fagiglandana TaxID=1458189 RepID=UPI002FEE48A9